MAGVIGALVLILITAYYMAVRPEPLVEGLVSLAPPARREHVRHVLARVRQSWIGWMEGVAIDMLITGVFTYVALTIVGLDFAIFFAVLSALLVVVPYFGAIAGAMPPVLFALTDSPGKALLVLGAYIVVQQLESNVTMPVIMSQRVRMHPAMIAIGVVVVGPAVRLRGPVRGRADPVADHDLRAGVLGQGARRARAPEEPPGHRAARGNRRGERRARGRRPARPARAGGRGGAGQTSFVMAITAPIVTNTTIRIWTTIQKRGSSLTR